RRVVITPVNVLRQQLQIVGPGLRDDDGRDQSGERRGQRQFRERTVHGLRLRPCHLANMASRSNRRPRRYTREIFRVLWMSSSGLASRTTKSALLPAARVPMSVILSSSAGRDVAATIASAGDKPSCTQRASS